MPRFNPGDIVVRYRSKSTNYKKKIFKVLEQNSTNYNSPVRVIDHKGKIKVLSEYDIVHISSHESTLDKNIHVAEASISSAERRRNRERAMKQAFNAVKDHARYWFPI